MSRHNYLTLQHISKKKQINFLDRVMLAAAFLSPIFCIPQVLGALNGNVTGLSLFTWAGLTFFAMLFLIYGIVHRLVPVIISNALWLVVDGLVVFSIVNYRFF
jgi:uncharacterized protein with PQ loop repeat